MLFVQYIAESWHKCRCEAAFIAKLSDAEGEASDEIIAMIVSIIANCDKYVLPTGKK